MSPMEPQEAPGRQRQRQAWAEASVTRAVHPPEEAAEAGLEKVEGFVGTGRDLHQITQPIHSRDRGTKNRPLRHRAGQKAVGAGVYGQQGMASLGRGLPWEERLERALQVRHWIT